MNMTKETVPERDKFCICMQKKCGVRKKVRFVHAGKQGKCRGHLAILKLWGKRKSFDVMIIYVFM